MSSISFDKAIEIALEQHRMGNFSRAEALYTEILRQDPGNVDALHLLGVLAHQGHSPEVAVQLIEAAIKKRPDVQVFHYNLAEALTALGRLEEAISAYRQAIDLAPDYFEAHNNLGNVLNELRRFDEAETVCRRAVEINPLAAAPLNNLGNALRGMRRIPAAIEAYRAAIDKRSDFSEAMDNLAVALCSVGQFDEGMKFFKEAVRLSPTTVNLHNNLGTALNMMGRNVEAAECFKTALKLNPEHVEANNNLGAVIRSLGHLEESIVYFRKAVELRPDLVEAFTNLAGVYKDLGKNEEAFEAIESALELRPEHSRLHYIRANILRDMNRLDEGIDAVREVLRIQPDSVSGLTCLGYCLLERGEIDEAMVALKRSIELKPDPQGHSNVLLTINYHPGYSQADLLDAHKSWAELHEKAHRSSWGNYANNKSPDRKLRIGYVSPDFRGHAVSYFLEPILEKHDHENFEIFGYAHLTSTDWATWRMRARIDQWRETSSLTPDKFAEQIREDQIDILVELAGHTANNSMPVFARKPAPVQINMIGFPSTTGLSAMDYRITDARCDPIGQTDQYNTESLIRMPRLFWCYRPPTRAPKIGPLPADTTGVITFTSVNNFTKVTPDVLRMWAQILAKVSNSRLIMQTSAVSSAHTQRKVTELFASFGISSDRFEFRPMTDMYKYLELLERSDITLDPFPFNGGTTTCHSLWMAAPVITLAGDRHASRMGLSMMTAIGLPEFVAHTPDEYVQIALNWANDLPRLREIRAGMRERLNASPLLDHAGYTRELEAAYRRVWKSWCSAS